MNSKMGERRREKIKTLGMNKRIYQIGEYINTWSKIKFIRVKTRMVRGTKSLEDESIVHGKLSDQGHRGIELPLKDKTEVLL